jgi:hypothetical protein
MPMPSRPDSERRKQVSFHEATLEGTLRADGTIELDQKPNLPPGRVQVLVRQVQPAQPSPPQETLLEFMQRSRRELEAAGSHFMNEQEISAWIEELRAEDGR